MVAEEVAAVLEMANVGHCAVTVRVWMCVCQCVRQCVLCTCCVSVTVLGLFAAAALVGRSAAAALARRKRIRFAILTYRTHKRCTKYLKV